MCIRNVKDMHLCTVTANVVIELLSYQMLRILKKKNRRITRSDNVVLMLRYDLPLEHLYVNRMTKSP